MRRLILAASCVLAVVLPAVAQAKPPTRGHVREYVHAYHAARSKFGLRAVGCKLVAPRRNCHGRVTDARVMKSVAVLERMLAPPRQVVPTGACWDVNTCAPRTPTFTGAADVTSPPVAVSGGASGGLPSCTWQPESGGDWNAVNPSSGAYGRYQILPSTAASNGCDLSTHDGQTRCAEKIYAGGRGASQWVNC